MTLTGKASKDFIKWLHFKHNLQPYNLFNEIIQYALIIEWFDSVGIYISVKRLCTSLKFRCWYFVITNEDGDYLNKHGYDESRINNDSRIEITKKAIKKANEIYNEK